MVAYLNTETKAVHVKQSYKPMTPKGNREEAEAMNLMAVLISGFAQSNFSSREAQIDATRLIAGTAEKFLSRLDAE